MRTPFRQIRGIAVAALCAAVLAACSAFPSPLRGRGDRSTTSAPPTSTVSSPNPTPTTPVAGSVIRRAHSYALTATSVRLKVTDVKANTTDNVVGDMAGTTSRSVSTDSKGSIEELIIGAKRYLRGDVQYWRSDGKTSPQEAALLATRYLDVSGDDAGAGMRTAFQLIDWTLGSGDLAQTVQHGRVERGKAPDGSATLRVYVTVPTSASVVVADDGSYRPISAETDEGLDSHMRYEFVSFNEALDIAAPHPDLIDVPKK